MNVKVNCLSSLFCAMMIMLVSNVLSIAVDDIDPKTSVLIALGISVLITPTFWLVYRHYAMSKHNDKVANLMENIVIFLPLATIVLSIVADSFMGIPPAEGVRNAALFAAMVSLIPVLIILYDAIQRGIIRFPLKKHICKNETHHVFIVESDGTLYTAFIKGNMILSKDKYYDANGYNITVNTEKFK